MQNRAKSRLNWNGYLTYPDPEAMHINGLSISWWDRSFYAFPPFAVIGKVLHKIVFDVATVIIVAPA